MEPLTIDELKAFDDDFIWLVMNGKGYYVEILHKLYTLADGDEVGILVGAYEYEEGLNYSDYGTKWIAYKNKEQAEAKADALESDRDNLLRTLGEANKELVFLKAEIKRIRHNWEISKVVLRAKIRKKTVREFTETLLSDEYIAYNDPEIVKEVAEKFGVEVK